MTGSCGDADGRRRLRGVYVEQPHAVEVIAWHGTAAGLRLESIHVLSLETSLLVAATS